MTRNAPGWAGLLTTGLAMLGAVSGPPSSGWLINESASVSPGLYRRADAPLALGALVATAQPGAVRPYLSTLGVPARMPLLKRIAAQGGEMVCLEKGTLRWPRGAVAVARKDRRGVTLPQWVGCRRLAPDELLLLGDTPTSFDSRYFGPVRRAALEGVYVEVIRW